VSYASLHWQRFNASASEDMASRKEALMNTVRQEVTLAGAQELMNVKTFCWTLKVELLSVLFP
jgi:hypothetical protein